MNDAKKGFACPNRHEGFLAKKLFEENREITDVSIAYIKPGGNGPFPAHTHAGHDHLFIVTGGSVVLEMEETYIRLGKNDAWLVRGEKHHRIINDTENEAVMLNISLKNGGKGNDQ